MQGTQEQHSATQLQALNHATPDRYASAGWLAIFLYIAAIGVVVVSVLWWLQERRIDWVAMVFFFAAALLLGGCAALIQLLRAIERNQRVAHEIAVRQIERTYSTE